MRYLPALMLIAVAATAARAQSDSVRADTAGARVGPPIRRISTAAAVSKQPIGSIAGVRELPDGRVLVNDGASRRLLLLDTNLVTERVVLDSMSEQENTYGNRAGALIAHRGDSSLFVDIASLAMLVIDPQGRIARVRSVPRAQDVSRYASSVGGANMFTDARGRLIYRVNANAAPPARRPPRGVPFVPQEPDSAFIVALDIETRQLDTLGAVRTPKEELTVRMSPNGGWSFNAAINPVPTQDEWTVLSDGSVAFVRWIDYRVDYLNADGTWSSSEKIPYEWQPIPQGEKERIVDSVKTTQQRQLRTQYTTSVIRYVNTYDRKYPPGFTAPDGYRPPNGFPKDWQFPPGVTFPPNYVYACAPGEEPKELGPAPGDSTPVPQTPPQTLAEAVRMEMVGTMGGPPPGQRSGSRPSCIPQPIPNLARIPDPPVMREVSVVHPRTLPDFRPPFTGGAVRADLDGNLWIRTVPVRRTPGGPVYDVVSRAGKLVDRLQVPPGYQLAGFGRGRVVYLQVRDHEGVHLARVRLR